MSVIKYAYRSLKLDNTISPKSKKNKKIKKPLSQLMRCTLILECNIAGGNHNSFKEFSS